jgi:SPP1 gp7 family putative phage head morphogenesis protein
MSTDHAIVIGLDLLRVDAHTRAQVIAILKRMERELIAQVAAGVTDWSKARIAQQMAEAGAVIRRYYDEAAGVAIDTTQGIYQVSATDAARTLAVGIEAAPVLPTLAAMEALAGNAVVQGATQAAWWEKQRQDVAFRFAAAVRQGLVAAETNQQIIRRVREELVITRANAAALVQTSVQTVANNARLATFRDNADIIKGLRWLSALDSHVCLQCAPRDGMTWSIEGVAKNATLPFRNPPLHFNCRCALVPLTRFSGLGDPQRASTDGPVSAKINFSDWLETKGVAFQTEVLGAGRTELFRAGKLTLQDLIGGNQKPLTLAALRLKYM